MNIIWDISLFNKKNYTIFYDKFKKKIFYYFQSSWKKNIDRPFYFFKNIHEFGLYKYMNI